MEAIDLPMIVDEKVKPNMPNPSENFTEMLPGEVALEMISIPAGESMMGSDSYDDLKDNEYYYSAVDHDAASPMHKVKVQAFCMGKYPITQAQYEAVMGNNPSFNIHDDQRYRKQYYDAHKNNPVEQVNWNMAQKFCQKLSEITGKNYQLPTESQWEYACRAGTKTKYFFGNKLQYLPKYARVQIMYENRNRADNEYSETTPIGYIGFDYSEQIEKPNPWGLYGLLGNVWEWCEDDWIDGYYGHPSDGSAVNTGSNQKVVRGGCFSSSQNDCCSFSRSFRDNDIADKTIGFRVVCVP
jgi:formylglycine-generating enzyme required for sulfatase activity